MFFTIYFSHSLEPEFTIEPPINQLSALIFRQLAVLAETRLLLDL